MLAVQVESRQVRRKQKRDQKKNSNYCEGRAANRYQNKNHTQECTN